MNHFNKLNEISLEELIPRLGDEALKILDVRESWEMPKVDHQDVINISVQQIELSLDQIPTTTELIVVCQHGIRSVHVIKLLQNRYNFTNLVNLKGGIENYTLLTTRTV